MSKLVVQIKKKKKIEPFAHKRESESIDTKTIKKLETKEIADLHEIPNIEPFMIPELIFDLIDIYTRYGREFLEEEIKNANPKNPRLLIFDINTDDNKERRAQEKNEYFVFTKQTEIEVKDHPFVVCKECGGKKFRYSSEQRRSGDEAATNKYRCLVSTCGYINIE